GPVLCSVRLHDPAPLIHHNEPVKRDGRIVGYITSGAHSHTFGVAVGLCFIDLATGETIDTDIGSGSYSVVVEGREYAADVSLSAFYDPTNARMLA
ncbi:MAG: glycine cleavage T C-terminal barrel domain-containing protein, partial [Alphaproteobacteria bacterium]